MLSVKEGFAAGEEEKGEKKILTEFSILFKLQIQPLQIPVTIQNQLYSSFYEPRPD